MNLLYFTSISTLSRMCQSCRKQLSNDHTNSPSPFQMDPANPNSALIPTCATISTGTSVASPSSAIATIAGGGGGGGVGGIGGTSSAMVPVGDRSSTLLSPTLLSPGTNTATASIATSRDDEDDSSQQISSAGSKSSGQR